MTHVSCPNYCTTKKQTQCFLPKNAHFCRKTPIFFHKNCQFLPKNAHFCLQQRKMAGLQQRKITGLQQRKIAGQQQRKIAGLQQKRWLVYNTGRLDWQFASRLSEDFKAFDQVFQMFGLFFCQVFQSVCQVFQMLYLN